MGDAQGELEFTSDFSEPSIRVWLSLPRIDPRCLFYAPLSVIGNRSALPIIIATGRPRTINDAPLHQSSIPPIHPRYAVFAPKHCPDIPPPHVGRFLTRRGVKAARRCQVLHQILPLFA